MAYGADALFYGADATFYGKMQLYMAHIYLSMARMQFSKARVPCSIPHEEAMLKARQLRYEPNPGKPRDSYGLRCADGSGIRAHRPLCAGVYQSFDIGASATEPPLQGY